MMRAMCTTGVLGMTIVNDECWIIQTSNHPLEVNHFAELPVGSCFVT